MIRSCLVVLFALLVSPAAWAETPVGKKHALVVGVQRYDHDSLPDLKHTENDVEELRTVLLKAGFRVGILTSTRGNKHAAAKPTARNIRAGIGRLLANVTKHDLVVVALSGHGMQLPVEVAGRHTEEAFFCPSDAKPHDTRDLGRLRETLISLKELFKELEESGAGVKLLLVDACRNEPKSGKNVDVDNLPRPPRGTAALFSCKSGEKAFETDKLGTGHGVFFYYVLEGLKGKAKNDKGDITWGRLSEYVTDKVSDAVPVLISGGAKQTPHEVRNLTGKSPVLVAVSNGAQEGEALFQRGWKHATGQGAKKDYTEALRLFRKAADQNHAMAQNNIGWIYQNGLGVDKDHAEAVRWYRKAAAQAEPHALTNLGTLYERGLGVPRDLKEARKWYAKAAAKGNPYAKQSLARLDSVEEESPAQSGGRSGRNRRPAGRSAVRSGKGTVEER